MYLPGLERRASCQRDRRDRAESDEDAEYPVAHNVSSSLVGLEALVRLHARPPRGPRASPQKHENRPDTFGRSVALLTQPHPKCPFQVTASARPSVLTFPPLVLKYQEAPGL